MSEATGRVECPAPNKTEARARQSHKLTFQAFKSSPEVQKRLIQAYELMLGFYGIQLEDSTSGRVCRAPNYVARFRNLNW